MIWRLCLGVPIVLGISIGPATAQTVPFDPAPLEACLDEDYSSDCIGTGASACMQAGMGGSNVGMSMCWRAEGDWWDAELNRVYRALIELRTARDAELDELGAAGPRTVPALRQAQRAWISWRDATCAWEVSLFGTGSGAGPAANACRMRLTGEQALRLDAHLAAMGG